MRLHGIFLGVCLRNSERSPPFLGVAIDRLGLSQRCACIIGGDTTGRLKPHPAPLLAASAAIGVEPGACCYVGDDCRDVEAGRAAGMRTIAVRYGYLNGGAPDEWGADVVVNCPQDVLWYV